MGVGTGRDLKALEGARGQEGVSGLWLVSFYTSGAPGILVPCPHILLPGFWAYWDQQNKSSLIKNWLNCFKVMKK